MPAVVKLIVALSLGGASYSDTLKPIICKGFPQLTLPCTLIFDSRKRGSKMGGVALSRHGVTG